MLCFVLPSIYSSWLRRLCAGFLSLSYSGQVELDGRKVNGWYIKPTNFAKSYTGYTFCDVHGSPISKRDKRHKRTRQIILCSSLTDGINTNHEVTTVDKVNIYANNCISVHFYVFLYQLSWLFIVRFLTNEILNCSKSFLPLVPHCHATSRFS